MIAARLSLCLEHRLNARSFKALPAVSEWPDFNDCHGPAFCVFRDASLYVHLNRDSIFKRWDNGNTVNQSNNNGESQSRTRRLAPKHHNAKLCPLDIRERIVNALANGDSKRSIARALRVSIHTINAVAEQEWQQVASRKAKLAARYEKLADLYTERQIDELESGAKIPLNLCQSGGGIATDKAMALRGEPALTIHVEHTHSHQMELVARFNEAMQRLEKSVKARVVGAEPVTSLPLGDASVDGKNAA
jgi:hypothetical protein